MAPLKKPMPAASKVRAMRLRRRLATGGKALSPAEKEWLGTYEVAVQRPSSTPTAKPAIDMRPIGATFNVTAKKPPTWKNAKGGAASPPSGAVKHTTDHTENYASQTWVPITPIENPDDKAAPLVAEKVDTAALEMAAVKIGGVLALITAAGLQAAKELAAAGQLPVGNELLAAGLDAKMESAMLAHVAECGRRVAIKYGFGTAWQYEDEATVTLTALGSAFCVIKARQLKAAPAPAANTPTPTPKPEQLEVPFTKPRRNTETLRRIFGEDK